jgi:hypothetical protein
MKQSDSTLFIVPHRWQIIIEIIYKMRVEYKNIMTRKLTKKLNRHVQTQVDKRYRHRMSELKLESLIDIRNTCNELIQWTKK